MNMSAFNLPPKLTISSMPQLLSPEITNQMHQSYSLRKGSPVVPVHTCMYDVYDWSTHIYFRR